MAIQPSTEPSTLVIFGGTGDLARRKLLPALGKHAASGALAAHTQIIGVAQNPANNEAKYRALARDSMAAAGVTHSGLEGFCRDQVHYQPLGEGTRAEYEALRERIESIERSQGLPPRRAFYLALPTDALADAISGLTAVGLNQSLAGGWTRVVVEKPFGHDLASARELVELMRGSFEEEQIFRIDHYLGKETVQNLLAFRFGNTIFESVWNRDRIAAVEIMVSEELGVGTRARYYDKSGAMRDMVQNHLAQLLALVAMEVPPLMDAESVRYEKAKVLRSIAPLSKNDVVFGQYTEGDIGGTGVDGYLQEEGIPADSRTETFAALRVNIQNWRWQGVPFYLRTGKRLGRRLTRIGVQFKESPVCMFEKNGICKVSHNVLTLTMQPDEGFSLYMDVKEPGSIVELKRIPLTFRHSDHFDALPEAYETLLLDVLRGDQTLFVHSNEVIRSWKVFDPLLTMDHTIHPYASGSYGPAAAEKFGIQDKDLMRSH
ncbi:MAG: glucose-6-phosphate dehydrogenase [Planctomycetota bacterium]